jgi:hypothetical protein
MRKTVDIKEIKSNNENPRYIKDEKFNSLVQSIKDFPEMLEKRPLVVDENMIVIGGNMRLKALQKAGIKEVHIDIAKGWSDKQKKEFIIKDNISFGEWDWNVLANDWLPEDLNEWGLDVPNWDEEIKFEEEEDIEEDYSYPNDIEKSHVRMIQLFLNEETEPIFKKYEIKLREKFGTDNVTDTVFESLKELYLQYGKNN